MTATQAKKLGECVKRFARSKAGYTILGDEITSYSAGGCFILASAVKRLLGTAGRLTGVFASLTPDPIDAVTQHALVKVGDVYIDADGANDESTLRKLWARNERYFHARLVPLEGPYLAEAGAFACDPRRVNLVYETLKAMCR